MITEHDINKAIAEILTQAGFNVVASEVDEGFKKPAVFVTVYPSSAVKLTCGGATQQVTDTVEVRYIPAVETAEECVNVANKIKSELFYKTVTIKNRHLTVEEINFEIEDYILYVNFDLSFIQEIPSEEEYEKMITLKIGGNV